MISWYATACWICLAIVCAVPIIESIKYNRNKKRRMRIT